MSELVDAEQGAVLLFGGACALVAVLLLVRRPTRGGAGSPVGSTDRSDEPAQGIAPRIRRRLGHRLVGRSASRRHDGEALRRDAAELLRQLAALLQSGRSPGQAWGDLRDHWTRSTEKHPLAVVCADVARAEVVGDGAAAGLRRASDAVQSRAGSLALAPGDAQVLGEVLGRLRGAVALSEETGAPLADLTRRLAAAAEEEAELQAAIRTAVAGPQTTQLILVLLPLAGVGLGQIMGAGALALLFDGGVGTVCLVLGLALLAAGWWWGRGMIRAAMPHG